MFVDKYQIFTKALVTKMILLQHPEVLIQTMKCYVTDKLIISHRLQENTGTLLTFSSELVYFNLIQIIM